MHTLESTWSIPAIAIVSTAFSAQAIFQSEALGASEPDRHIVLAQHPISDATPAEIGVKADELYADLVRQLTSNKPTSNARRNRLRTTAPSAMCLMGA